MWVFFFLNKLCWKPTEIANGPERICCEGKNPKVKISGLKPPWFCALLNEEPLLHQAREDHLLRLAAHARQCRVPYTHTCTMKESAKGGTGNGEGAASSVAARRQRVTACHCSQSPRQGRLCFSQQPESAGASAPLPCLGTTRAPTPGLPVSLCGGDLCADANFKSNPE